MKYYYCMKKILARRIQQYVKSKIHHDQIGFIPVSTSENIFNAIHHINRLKKKNQFTTPIQQCSRRTSYFSQARKRNATQIRKEETKLFLFRE